MLWAYHCISAHITNFDGDLYYLQVETGTLPRAKRQDDIVVISRCLHQKVAKAESLDPTLPYCVALTYGRCGLIDQSSVPAVPTDLGPTRFCGAVRDQGLIDIERVDEVLPGLVVEAKDSLVACCFPLSSTLDGFLIRGL